MSDDKTTDGTPTGTPNPPEDTGKTYSEEEVQKLIAGAKTEGEKAGETKAYRHWQSVNDRVVAAERTTNATLRQELQALKDKTFESLSPEDKIKALREEMKSGAAVAPQSKDEPSKPEPTSPSTGQVGDDVAAIRESVNTALKEYGIDPTKVDWADDAVGSDAMKRFLRSIVAQLKPADGSKPNPAPETSDANRVDTSRSAGSHVVDLKSLDPKSLIASGLSKPFKG